MTKKLSSKVTIVISEIAPEVASQIAQVLQSASDVFDHSFDVNVYGEAFTVTAELNESEPRIIH